MNKARRHRRPPTNWYLMAVSVYLGAIAGIVAAVLIFAYAGYPGSAMATFLFTFGAAGAIVGAIVGSGVSHDHRGARKTS